jgi:DNA repair protein RadC
MPPPSVRRRRAPANRGKCPRDVPAPSVAHDAPPVVRVRLRSAADVADYLTHLRAAEQEHLWCLGLDAHHRVVTSNCVALGTVNEVKVVQRDVFRELVRNNCAAFIVVHNHPSGECVPSPQDTGLTFSLQKTGATLGIPLIDHVVLGGDTYYSYAERGHLAGEKGPDHDRRDS